MSNYHSDFGSTTRKAISPLSIQTRVMRSPGASRASSPSTPTPMSLMRLPLSSKPFAGLSKEYLDPPEQAYGDNDLTPRENPGRQWRLQELEKIIAEIGSDDLESLTRVRDAVTLKCKELEEKRKLGELENAPDTLPNVAFIDDGNKKPARSVKIADWELGREIGAGNYSKVFDAKNRTSCKTEAVKVMVKKDLTSEDLLNASREHESLRMLGNHPNIAGLTRALQSPDYIYFFMDFAKGKELFDFVKKYQQNKRDVPQDAVKRILSSMASALAHCHRESVCHRDIKPENIMVDQDYSAILVDFGCACPRYELFGQCVGSKGFIAPECLLGTARDGAPADIWSLGVVLLEMLNGLRTLSRSLGWDSKEITTKECGEQLMKWFADPVAGLIRIRSFLGVTSQFDRDELLASMLDSNPGRRPAAEAI